MKKKNGVIRPLMVAAYTVFIAISWWVGFEPGRQISLNFVSFLVIMIKILPCAFILVGLFEVWVKSETVDRHLGQQSGIVGYLWMILLASTTVGGLYVAFPIAYSLYNKGAKIAIVLTYLGASAVCRIPMVIFEASFLGIKFSLVRLLISIPLVILTSIWMGKYLEKSGYRMRKSDQA